MLEFPLLFFISVQPSEPRTENNLEHLGHLFPWFQALVLYANVNIILAFLKEAKFELFIWIMSGKHIRRKSPIFN